MDIHNLTLSPKQANFLANSTHSYNIASGVTRSGKTMCQILRAYKEIYNLPNGSLCLFSGRTSESLYDNVIRDFLSLDIIGDFIYHSQPMKITVKSKRIEIRCVGADSELATNRIQGKTVFLWLADEIVAHPESFVNMAISRCSGGGKQALKLWTCNPSNPSHFIKTKFIDNNMLDVKNWYFGFPDNPILAPELITELKQSFTGSFYDRMILGKWSVAEGAVFDQYSRERHYIPVSKYPEKAIVQYIIGQDFGYSEGHAMAMLLIAKDNEGVYYVIDEIVREKQLIDKSLVDIMNKKGWFNLPLWYYNGLTSQKYEIKPEFIYADSARPEYIFLMNQLCGITCIGAIKTSKIEMINSVQMMLQPDTNNKCRLYFLDNGNLRIILDEMDSYRWLTGKDAPVKEKDNCVDALQYAIHMVKRGTARPIKDLRFRT